jgi:CubicO group peptidase (beta-lactamase class C family)
MGAQARSQARRPAGNASLDDLGLEEKVVECLVRWPSAGVAAGVVKDGSLEWFRGHGVANIESGEPITSDTVFRIGSLTKTITAVAVLQLWERGLVDLDAPANQYLRTFPLIAADPDFRPATVRHLLTHTAGIGYWRRLSDLLRPGLGSGDTARSAPALADYYRPGLLVEVEPGTKWAYTNHGFAALGQIVEDVTGETFERYIRTQVFGPLGMDHTDLVRSARVRPHLACGYVLHSRGLTAVADYAVPTAAGCGAYSTSADVARYLAALLQGGANDHGSVLKPETVASMFEPHYQPDPRVAGMGLGFEPGEASGHKTVGKGGILSGFLSAVLLAPEDGLGVVVLGNTGRLDGRGVPEPLADALLRRLLSLPDDAIRTDIAPHAESWHQFCGWYAPEPGTVTNLFTRAMLGVGVEVVVRGNRLMLKPLTPVPSMRHGVPLHPDDPDDARVFRAEFPDFGKSFRVVFSGEQEGGGPAARLLIDLVSLRRRPDAVNPRTWMTGAATATAVALAARQIRKT